MSVSSITLSAGRIAGIFDVSNLAQSAIPEGAVVSYQTSTDDNDCILPSGANAVNISGVSMSAGSVPGGTATSGSDTIAVQKLGRAKTLLVGSGTCAKGQQAVVANSSGHVTPRTKWSTSAQVLGSFAQDHTAGSSAEFVAVDLAPYTVEICMPVTGYSATAIGATTKYLTAPAAGAAGSAQVPLFAAFSACTIRNLQAVSVTAPAGSDTAVFTVQKSSDNGATWTDTALTCTITGTAKSNSDSTHTAAIAAGDLLAIKCVSSGTTAAGTGATFIVS